MDDWFLANGHSPGELPSLNPEAERQRCFVTLTVIHDSRHLPGAKIITDGIWPLEYVRSRIEDNLHPLALAPRETFVRTALDEAKAELAKLAAEAETGRVDTKHKVRHARRADGVAGFTAWKNAPRRTCFVMDNNKFMFWHNGEQKNLKLGAKGHCHKLLSLFAAAEMLAQKTVKEEICAAKVKPFEAVRDVNRALNNKISASGFKGIPANVAFVYHDDKTKTYTITPKVLDREKADELWGSDS